MDFSDRDGRKREPRRSATVNAAYSRNLTPTEAEYSSDVDDRREFDRLRAPGKLLRSLVLRHRVRPMDMRPPRRSARFAPPVPRRDGRGTALGRVSLEWSGSRSPGGVVEAPLGAALGITARQVDASTAKTNGQSFGRLATRRRRSRSSSTCPVERLVEASGLRRRRRWSRSHRGSLGVDHVTDRDPRGRRRGL